MRSLIEHRTALTKRALDIRNRDEAYETITVDDMTQLYSVYCIILTKRACEKSLQSLEEVPLQTREKMRSIVVKNKIRVACARGGARLYAGITIFGHRVQSWLASFCVYASGGPPGGLLRRALNSCRESYS